MSEWFNIAIWEMEFLSPHWLWLLIIVPFAFILFNYLARKGNNQLRFSRSSSRSKIWFWTKQMAFFLGLTCFLIPLSRPHNTVTDPPKIDYKNGINIILAIDASGSMLAQDFEPNRLEVAKSVAIEFVQSRLSDRIGLVVYEGEAYTACPATLDYEALTQQIAAIEPGLLEPGTAVGNGLGVAVTRLRSDSLVSKVIVLLTDGTNNAGTISPEEAAELARAKSCKVYTIGVGSRGLAPTPVMTPIGIQYENLPVEIDEEALSEIAKITGGKYFRATNKEALYQIYKEIDRLETRKIETNLSFGEQPITLTPFFVWGILFLLLGWMIQQYKFKLDV